MLTEKRDSITKIITNGIGLLPYYIVFVVNNIVDSIGHATDKVINDSLLYSR